MRKRIPVKILPDFLAAFHLKPVHQIELHVVRKQVAHCIEIPCIEKIDVCYKPEPLWLAQQRWSNVFRFLRQLSQTCATSLQGRLG